MTQGRMLFAIILFVSASLAQAQSWTWMKGAKVKYQYGTFGTKKIPDPGNTPGARWYSVSGTDAVGNLWLFGGNGYAESTQGFLNDLWKYSPTTGNWSWITGSKVPNMPGTYGNVGVPYTTATPGGRANAASWVDNNGNFWIFGGYGYVWNDPGYPNDLWKFNPINNEWTWISPANIVMPWSFGVYGTKGTASTSNMPGSRTDAATWTDANGNLWMFGGSGWGVSSSSSGLLNDLWKYEPSNNRWTWIQGSNICCQPNVYGSLGSPSPANTPGARSKCVTWSSGGYLWLFGGKGFDGDKNDLWRLDPSSNQWTWMGGSSGIQQAGNYGTLGIPASTNMPGARYGSVAWTDGSGKLWLFGGNGKGASSSGELNDLWKYDPATNQWTWMKGATQPDQLGIYGTLGIAHSLNMPGARKHPIAWTTNGSYLWLFGGMGNAESPSGIGELNDLWRFALNSPPVAQCTDVTVSTAAGCQAIAWINNGSYDPDNDPITSTQNPYPPYPIGTTNVTLTVTDSKNTSSSCSAQVTVVDNIPPSITAPASRLIATDPGQCTASLVDLGVPVTSDNCGIASVTNNAPIDFPKGSTTVTWIVTDIHDNTTSAFQVVTVQDNIPPVARCRDITVPLNANGTVTITPSMVDNGSTDNCGIAEISVYPMTFGCTNKGTNTVTLHVTDGNSAVGCQAIVTVIDDTPPVISPPPLREIFVTGGNCYATNFLLTPPSVTDNCGPNGITFSNDAPSQYPVGETIVTWRVEDASGNYATATQTVRVIDNLLPSIGARPPVTLYTDPNACSASNFTLVAPPVIDNCG